MISIMVFIATDGKEFGSKAKLEEYENSLITGIPIVKLIRKKETKPRVIKNKPIISKEQSLYNSYIYSANKRKKEFNISFEFFVSIINKSCIYCGKEQSNGIDRLNSSIGYIESNCNPCCSICNWMKYNYTEEFFINHIKRILNYQNNK